MVDIIHDSPGLGFRIERIWAFLSIGKDDNDEGVIAMTTVNGTMPLIAADEARLKSLRPMAQRLAKQLGRPVKLAMFERRVDVETIEP